MARARHSRLRRLAALAALVLTLCLLPAASAATLRVTADRDQVYVDESLLLTLRVEDVGDEVGEARFDASLDTTFELLGRQSDSRIFTRIVNGRRTMQQSIARVLTYRATPHTNGTLVIRSVTVDHRGQPLTAPGPTIRVVGIEPQPYIRVTLTASKEAVLVEEPFDITLTVTAKRLPADYQEHDPFIADETPKLEIPYLSEEVPQGLRGPDPGDVLNPLIVRQRGQFGFGINNHTTRRDPFADPFNFEMFGRPSIARFALPRSETSLDGSSAWSYSLTVRYTPQTEGAYTFGPALFKGQVVTAVDASRRPVAQNIFAVGAATTVRVVPPPEEGRPASFIGSVGKHLDAASKLDTQQCKQGDPLTLTLDLTGDFSLSNLKPPALSLIPEIAKSFRSYDDAVRGETIEGGRRFTYTVRPLATGTIEFPPIPISFYDTEQHTYRTVSTDPIPLRVEAVQQFDINSIIDATANGTDSTTAIQVRMARDIPAAITVAPSALAMPPTLTAALLLRWLLPAPLVTALALLLRWILRNRLAWRRQRRHRRATPRALAHLRRAKSPDTALTSIALFFEERFDLASEAFSPMDAAQALSAAGATEQLASRLKEAVQPLFDASFRPDTPDPAILTNAKRDLPELLRECGSVRTLPPPKASPPRASGSRGALVLPLLLALTLGLAQGAATNSVPLPAIDSAPARPAPTTYGTYEQRFLWNQANARMASAETPADFAEAAEIYTILLERGARSAAVHRNLGTALLLAEAPEAAIDALLRAERHGGSSADLRRNLELALTARNHMRAGATDTVPSAELPWMRAPLFWHYQLPLQKRVTILLLLYNALWLAALLRIARRRAAARGLAIASLTGLVLFGSSVLVSLHQDARPPPPPVYHWVNSSEGGAQ